MKDQNIKTIRFPITADSRLQKMADKCGLTRIDFFIAMVDYFYKSKKDPLDLNDELLKNALMKNHQQYIGFIKSQENMLLIPIKTEMDRVSVSQSKIIERFNTQILKANTDLLNNQNTQDQKLNAIGMIMDTMQKGVKSKEALKSQFMFILESYIKSRDAFGMMTSGREKEELIAVTKAQISLL